MTRGKRLLRCSLAILIAAGLLLTLAMVLDPGAMEVTQPPGYDAWPHLRTASHVSVLNEHEDRGLQHAIELVKVRLQTPEAVDFLVTTYGLRPVVPPARLERWMGWSGPAWWFADAPSEQYEADGILAGLYFSVWVDRSAGAAYLARVQD